MFIPPVGTDGRCMYIKNNCSKDYSWHVSKKNKIKWPLCPPPDRNWWCSVCTLSPYVVKFITLRVSKKKSNKKKKNCLQNEYAPAHRTWWVGIVFLTRPCRKGHLYLGKGKKKKKKNYSCDCWVLYVSWNTGRIKGALSLSKLRKQKSNIILHSWTNSLESATGPFKAAVTRFYLQLGWLLAVNEM